LRLQARAEVGNRAAKDRCEARGRIDVQRNAPVQVLAQGALIEAQHFAGRFLGGRPAGFLLTLLPFSETQLQASGIVELLLGKGKSRHTRRG